MASLSPAAAVAVTRAGDVTLVEIDVALAELATANIQENHLGQRARAIACDALSAAARRAAGLGD